MLKTSNLDVRPAVLTLSHFGDCDLWIFSSAVYPGLPRSGKKFWKMKKIPGQGKVREFHFQSGKFRKMKKSHGKVREFQNFPKVAS